MHTLRRASSLLFLFLLASTARATKITIGDPPTPVSVNPIDNSDIPFQVTFGSCAGLAGFTNNMGCFAFYNDTSSAWTSITLTLTSGTPSGSAFSCASDTYTNLNCSDPMVLTFSGGSIPNTNPLQTFVIAEDDLSPASLTFSADVTFATTPEPSGIVLLGTGLLSACAVMWGRRRSHA